MISRSFILIFIFLFISNLSYAQKNLGQRYNYAMIDFFITLPDNTQLDCTKLIPEGSPPTGGWPCLIVCHGYGLTKYAEMEEAEEYAGYGYYTLVYSMRGQGISGGQSNLISRLEMNDLMYVVQYVKNDANTNDNRIAIHGGSQGGILPFMAVCNGLNVRTILPDFASPEFASSWIENGCVKMTLLWSLSYTQNIVRYNSLVSRFKPWIYSPQKDKWDSLAYYVPRDRDFMNQVANCQKPVLISNVWQDLFFNTLGMIRSIYILPYNNYRVYWGALDGHGSDPDENEIDYQSELVYDWLDYWLRDEPNGVMNDPNQKFVYAISQFPLVYHDTIQGWTWERYNSATWPPAGIQDINLYFHSTGQLLPNIYTGSEVSVTLFNDVDPSLSLETAVNYEFTGPQFQALFHKNELVFETPQLLQDCKMIGIPKVGLFYSSDADICQFNFQIYDVRPNGNKKLVTRINYTDRYYTPNSVRSQYLYGLAYAHTFRQGSKIRVVLTNLDNEVYNWFLRTNPHVLPVMKRAYNKMYINNSSRSYITLPLDNFVIGIKNITTTIPQEFKLYQNYPNPFNPVTKIKFDIPANSKWQTANVKMVIYDIIGKEVATLVNEALKPGTYEVDWDGSKYASGVYFYNLIAGDFSETMRMVLVK